MAYCNAPNFPEQIKECRKKIRESFKRSHEALQVRENILLSRVDEIEREYNSKTEKINKLVESLDKNKSFTSETLRDNELNETYKQICSVIDTKIKQLTRDTDQSGPWVDGSWVMGQMGHVNRWVTWVMGHGSVTHDP